MENSTYQSLLPNQFLVKCSRSFTHREEISSAYQNTICEHNVDNRIEKLNKCLQLCEKYNDQWWTQIIQGSITDAKSRPRL